MIIENIDIALLQKAYCGDDGALLSLIPINWARFASIGNSTHLVIQNTDLNYSHLLTGDNCVFITAQAKEGKLIVVSTFAAPRFDFEDTLAEWQHIVTQRHFFICGGDFNANSTVWGCNQDTIRGDDLTEFVAVHNL